MLPLCWIQGAGFALCVRVWRVCVFACARAVCVCVCVCVGVGVDTCVCVCLGGGNKAEITKTGPNRPTTMGLVLLLCTALPLPIHAPRLLDQRTRGGQPSSISSPAVNRAVNPPALVLADVAGRGLPGSPTPPTRTW